MCKIILMLCIIRQLFAWCVAPGLPNASLLWHDQVPLLSVPLSRITRIRFTMPTYPISVHL